jgi:hypothetical protein
MPGTSSPGGGQGSATVRAPPRGGRAWRLHRSLRSVAPAGIRRTGLTMSPAELRNTTGIVEGFIGRRASVAGVPAATGGTVILSGAAGRRCELVVRGCGSGRGLGLHPSVAWGLTNERYGPAFFLRSAMYSCFTSCAKIFLNPLFPGRTLSPRQHRSETFRIQEPSTPTGADTSPGRKSAMAASAGFKSGLGQAEVSAHGSTRTRRLFAGHRLEVFPLLQSRSPAVCRLERAFTLPPQFPSG